MIAGEPLANTLHSTHSVVDKDHSTYWSYPMIINFLPQVIITEMNDTCFIVFLGRAADWRARNRQDCHGKGLYVQVQP